MFDYQRPEGSSQVYIYIYIYRDISYIYICIQQDKIEEEGEEEDEKSRGHLSKVIRRTYLRRFSIRSFTRVTQKFLIGKLCCPMAPAAKKNQGPPPNYEDFSSQNVGNSHGNLSLVGWWWGLKKRAVDTGNIGQHLSPEKGRSHLPLIAV
jgi:hypothetical protein